MVNLVMHGAVDHPSQVTYKHFLLCSRTMEAARADRMIGRPEWGENAPRGSRLGSDVVMYRREICLLPRRLHCEFRDSTRVAAPRVSIEFA
jgi:hypothetical protein